jgi:DNA-binding IclR family transcriptional regulator
VRQMRQGPVSIKEMADRLELPRPVVVRYVLALQRRGLAALDGIDGATPRFRALEQPGMAA